VAERVDECGGIEQPAKVLEPNLRADAADVDAESHIVADITEEFGLVDEVCMQAKVLVRHAAESALFEAPEMSIGMD